MTEEELATIEQEAQAEEYGLPMSRLQRSRQDVIALVVEVRRLRALAIDLGCTPDPIESKS